MKSSALASGGVKCPTCMGQGLVLPPRAVGVAERLADLFRGGALPVQDPTKGQYYFSPFGVASIIALMQLRDDIENHSIACLTTPLLALGLAIFGSAARVAAFDIDGDLLQYVKRSAPSVDIVRYDISAPVPRDHQGKYDRFVIDPFYAVDHYRICLSRALDLVGCRDRCAGYVVVPPKHVSPPGETVRRIPLSTILMAHLAGSRVYLTDIRQGLAEYYASEAEAKRYQHRFKERGFPTLLYDKPFRHSDVIRVETTPLTKSHVPGEVALKVPVTTGERLGREGRFVMLPSRQKEADCRLCSPEECYKPKQRAVRHRGRQHGVAGSYVAPAAARITPRSTRLPNEMLPATDSNCLGFFDIKDRVVLVLKGPLSRDIYNCLVREGKAHSQLPDHAWLGQVIVKALTSYRDTDVPDNLDELSQKCVLFAATLIEAGLFDWPALAD